MDRPAVILDTNVFVAAGFKPKSASGRLIAAARDGRLCLVWHERTRRETQRILSRVPRLGWAPVADLFGDAGRFDGDLDLDAFAVVPDPDDRKFAALAAATGAPLATGDDDLLGVRERVAITILRPNELLHRLEGEGDS